MTVGELKAAMQNVDDDAHIVLNETSVEVLACSINTVQVDNWQKEDGTYTTRKFFWLYT
jgi:hypothetical protein